MDISNWLAVTTICILGAISPGPSLAIIANRTLTGGRLCGLAAAIAHGIGVGLYAAAAIGGISYLLIQSHSVFNALQIVGALFLLYLGCKLLLTKPITVRSSRDNALSDLRLDNDISILHSARDGFFIVFLNPKIAIFFTALFSQFIGPDFSLIDRTLLAITAAVIDGGWYILVASVLSHSVFATKVRQHENTINRVFGLVLLLLAMGILLSYLPSAHDT